MSAQQFATFLIVAIAALGLTTRSINTAFTVDDPLVPQQWGWYRISADRAFESGAMGTNVVVAVLDTGVNASHPDLCGNIIDGWNYIDNNNDISDADGHGTKVVGIIAAVANNSLGIAGAASGVKIMPLKVIGATGGSWIDLDKAILRAAHSGARIITMSLGGEYSRPSLALEAAINHAYQEGCIIVAAAGNDNSSDPSYPAACENVIAVAAIDETSVKAGFSNYGAYIDFCAPGVNILTTSREGSYVSDSGTSFAAPFVAGVIALMVSRYPQLTNDQVISTLRSEVEDLGEQGWDQYYGWGLVNAFAACSGMPIPEFSCFLAVLLVSTLIAILALQKSVIRCRVRIPETRLL
jgi:thermitase